MNSHEKDFLLTMTTTDFDFFAATDVGRRRKNNEDALICIPQVGIFLVADGMGGEKYGEVASHMAADRFVNLVTPYLADEEMTIPFDYTQGEYFLSVLVHAIEGANQAVVEYSEENATHKGMGSTLTAAVWHDNTLFVGHVGDTRLYRITLKKILLETEDHSKVQEMVRQKIISPEEAWNHPQKNVITRCVGRKKKITPDVFSLKIKDGDTFLLCSDGLTDMLRDEEIHQIILLSDSLRSAGNQLIQSANDRGGKDNITVVLFRLIGDK
jgi:protein phosphatase